MFTQKDLISVNFLIMYVPLNKTIYFLGEMLKFLIPNVIHFIN